MAGLVCGPLSARCRFGAQAMLAGVAARLSFVPWNRRSIGNRRVYFLLPRYEAARNGRAHLADVTAHAGQPLSPP